jgi:hypothetical protein
MTVGRSRRGGSFYALSVLGAPVSEDGVAILRLSDRRGC